MNRVILIGRLTKPIEMRRTNTGKDVGTFTLAVNRVGSENADYIRCTAWNKLASNMYQYTTTGSLVGVVGRLQSDSYEKNGEKVYTLDLVVEECQFLGGKKKDAG